LTESLIFGADDGDDSKRRHTRSCWSSEKLMKEEIDMDVINADLVSNSEISDGNASIYIVKLARSAH
jgi:hypothetical protein